MHGAKSDCSALCQLSTSLRFLRANCVFAIAAPGASTRPKFKHMATGDNPSVELPTEVQLSVVSLDQIIRKEARSKVSKDLFKPISRLPSPPLPSEK